jgi:hypothetical protein
MSAFPPQWSSVTTGSKVAVVLFVPLIAAALIVGGDAILPAVMGLLTITVVPFCSTRQSVVLIAGAVLTGYLATEAFGNPLAVVSLVTLSCLIAGLLSRLSAGVYGLAPIIAAVLGLNEPQTSALTAALVMAGVGLYVLVVVGLLKIHAEPQPVPWNVAVRHAAVMAVACGASTAVAVHYDWPKAYWLVMTLAIVLRPYAIDSLTRNRHRVIGTLAGAVLAAVLSPLPQPVLLVAAAICMALTMAYLLENNYVLQVTFMTPMVIFLISSGSVDDTLSLDGLRVIYTLGAAVVGGLVSLALVRQAADETAGVP